jgi:predicted DNA binding CopG/RHH family protein
MYDKLYFPNENKGNSMAKKVAKKRLGRPKSDSKRDTWLPVRVNAKEIEQVKEIAEKSGMSLTQYVRMMLGLTDTGYGAS